jgi:hypothetical protein
MTSLTNQLNSNAPLQPQVSGANQNAPETRNPAQKRTSQIWERLSSTFIGTENPIGSEPTTTKPEKRKSQPILRISPKTMQKRKSAGWERFSIKSQESQEAPRFKKHPSSKSAPSKTRSLDPQLAASQVKAFSRRHSDIHFDNPFESKQEDQNNAPKFENPFEKPSSKKEVSKRRTSQVFSFQPPHLQIEDSEESSSTQSNEPSPKKISPLTPKNFVFHIRNAKEIDKLQAFGSLYNILSKQEREYPKRKAENKHYLPVSGSFVQKELIPALKKLETEMEQNNLDSSLVSRFVKDFEAMIAQKDKFHEFKSSLRKEKKERIQEQKTLEKERKEKGVEADHSLRRPLLSASDHKATKLENTLASIYLDLRTSLYDCYIQLLKFSSYIVTKQDKKFTYKHPIHAQEEFTFPASLHKLLKKNSVIGIRRRKSPRSSDRRYSPSSRSNAKSVTPSPSSKKQKPPKVIRRHVSSKLSSPGEREFAEQYQELAVQKTGGTLSYDAEKLFRKEAPLFILSETARLLSVVKEEESPRARHNSWKAVHKHTATSGAAKIPSFPRFISERMEKARETNWKKMINQSGLSGRVAISPEQRPATPTLKNANQNESPKEKLKDDYLRKLRPNLRTFANVSLADLPVLMALEMESRDKMNSNEDSSTQSSQDQNQNSEN